MDGRQVIPWLLDVNHNQQTTDANKFAQITRLAYQKKKRKNTRLKKLSLLDNFEFVRIQ